MNLWKLLQGCEHTQIPLQRRPAPKREFKLEMPGVGTVLSVNGPQPGGYIYTCPSCKSDLPTSQNPRWETLYTQTRLPIASELHPIRRRPIAKSSSLATQSRSRTSGGYKREAISKTLRWDILNRDNFRCVKCGAKGDEAQLEVDHKTPVSLGGTNHPSNLQTLCRNCNRGKGARHG